MSSIAETIAEKIKSTEEEYHANKQRLGIEQPILPEDETALAPSPRNSVIDFFSLPAGWKNTVADTKRFDSGFAEMAGTTAGRVYTPEEAAKMGIKSADLLTQTMKGSALQGKPVFNTKIAQQIMAKKTGK